MTSERPLQIPIFPTSDLDRTPAFYSVLGFREENRYGGVYLIIEHQVGLELHFYGAGMVNTTRNDHAAYIRFTSAERADVLYASWAEAQDSPEFATVAGKAGRLVSPSDTDYGLREFSLLDADGNLLRIGGPISD